MSDSNQRDELRAKHRRNDAQRLEAVKEWVRYVRDHPAEVWGAQQNALIDSQLQSARESGLDVSHRLRLQRASDDPDAE